MSSASIIRGRRFRQEEEEGGRGTPQASAASSISFRPSVMRPPSSVAISDSTAVEILHLSQEPPPSSSPSYIARQSSVNFSSSSTCSSLCRYLCLDILAVHCVCFWFALFAILSMAAVICITSLPEPVYNYFASCHGTEIRTHTWFMAVFAVQIGLSLLRWTRSGTKRNEEGGRRRRPRKAGSSREPLTEGQDGGSVGHDDNALIEMGQVVNEDGGEGPVEGKEPPQEEWRPEDIREDEEEPWLVEGVVPFRQSEKKQQCDSSSKIILSAGALEKAVAAVTSQRVRSPLLVAAAAAADKIPSLVRRTDVRVSSASNEEASVAWADHSQYDAESDVSTDCSDEIPRAVVGGEERGQGRGRRLVEGGRRKRLLTAVVRMRPPPSYPTINNGSCHADTNAIGSTTATSGSVATSGTVTSATITTSDTTTTATKILSPTNSGAPINPCFEPSSLSSGSPSYFTVPSVHPRAASAASFFASSCAPFKKQTMSHLVAATTAFPSTNARVVGRQQNMKPMRIPSGSDSSDNSSDSVGSGCSDAARQHYASSGHRRQSSDNGGSRNVDVLVDEPTTVAGQGWEEEDRPLKVTGVCWNSVWMLSYYAIFFLGFHASLLGWRVYGTNGRNLQTFYTCKHMTATLFKGQLPLIRSIISDFAFIELFLSVVAAMLFTRKYSDPYTVSSYFRCRACYRDVDSPPLLYATQVYHSTVRSPSSCKWQYPSSGDGSDGPVCFCFLGHRDLLDWWLWDSDTDHVGRLTRQCDFMGAECAHACTSGRPRIVSAVIGLPLALGHLLPYHHLALWFPLLPFCVRHCLLVGLLHSPSLCMGTIRPVAGLSIFKHLPRNPINAGHENDVILTR
eukprot:GHVS01033078.1.p1 GENE.GHVS01033078.1~~GHVS01033078.1.p1  ORF type:complete len:851 (+),score=144.68 GHVS01033078.1:210-2762(+)